MQHSNQTLKLFPCAHDGIPLPVLNRIARAGSRPFLSRSGAHFIWGNVEGSTVFWFPFFYGVFATVER
jgi:hypothetical protein